jgi:hypothetical protein
MQNTTEGNTKKEGPFCELTMLSNNMGLLRAVAGPERTMADASGSLLTIHYTAATLALRATIEEFLFTKILPLAGSLEGSGEVSVNYYSDFCVDIRGAPETTERPPAYTADFATPLDSTSSVALLERSCFNCGDVDHALGACPVPRDEMVCIRNYSLTLFCSWR